MRAAGLEGRRKKRWRTTTIADPAAERARDLIQRDFAPRPGTDRRCAGDITYIMTWEGWAYLPVTWNHAAERSGLDRNGQAVDLELATPESGHMGGFHLPSSSSLLLEG